jgi:phosphohistidine phosphatase SixA/dienelactone hydrolase
MRAAACMVLLLLPITARGEPLPRDALLAALRRGGYVVVMRHATSPREPPTAATAVAGNQGRERQLDEAGRRSAAAMGVAIRAGKIPVGAVLSSPTFRAQQTARYAQLLAPTLQPELGDGGQSMQQAAEGQGAWLRKIAATPPRTGNLFVITHQPNIAAAFPQIAPPIDGEALVFGPRATLVGRLKIDDWGPPLPPSRRVLLTPPDGGSIQGDLYYGEGSRGVVLAHGGRFDKESWIPQAQALAAAGFRVLAIDLRGYGQSTGPGPRDDPPRYNDVLAAVRYLRGAGARSVAVVGASLGGGAAAEALSRAPGEIDRLVMLAAEGGVPDKMSGRKLFILCRNDREGEHTPRLPAIQALYDRVPQPKRLVILECAAHAQFIFQTDQAERLMREILGFLTAP